MADPPDPKFYYEHLSKHISHEESLINNRLTWMLTFEGFLFAALALVEISRSDVLPVRAFLVIISVAGILISLSCFSGIYAAYISIRQHKDEFKDKLDKYPMPGGWYCASRLGKRTSLSVPIIICLTWIALVISFSINWFPLQ